VWVRANNGSNIPGHRPTGDRFFSKKSDSFGYEAINLQILAIRWW